MTVPVFIEGSAVSIDVSLPVVGGAAVSPTHVAAAVTDLAGTVLVPSFDIAPGDIKPAHVRVQVPSPGNEATPGEMYALRKINVLVITATDTFNLTQFYAVRSATPLTKMVNSFQTVEEAMLHRLGMLEQPDYDASSESDRLNAMTLAFDRLTRFRYRVNIDETRKVTFLPGSGKSFIIDRISQLDAAEFDGLPPKFKEAICKAQIAEANYILRGPDEIAEKIDAGVVLEKIGESTTQFKTTAPMRSPVSPEAMRYLKGYFYRAVMIGRG